MRETIKAVMWKENRIFMKQTLPIFVMMFGGMIYGTIKLLMKMTDLIEGNSDLLSIYLFIYTIGSITLCGTVIALLSSVLDNKEEVLNSLLTSVHKSSLIWLGQYLYAVIVAVSTTIVALIGIVIVSKGLFFRSYRFGLRAIVLWLIIAPILAAIIVAIHLFLSWVIRYTIITMAMIFLVPGMVILCILNNTGRVMSLDITIIHVFGAAVILIVTNLIFLKIIDIIPKEYFIGK